MSASLKLFTPGDRSDCSLSLDEVFRDRFKPRLESLRRAASTIEDYERTLTVWREFWAASGRKPSLNEIDEETLDAFSDHLARERNGRTVNKQMGYIQTILDQCGPVRGRVTCLGRRFGLIDTVPQHVRIEESPSKRSRVVPLEQVERLYAKCGVTDTPRHQPAVKWEAALRLFFWAGLRRNDLFVNLRRSHWIRSATCPVSEVSVKWPHGWLRFVPQKTQRRKPDPLVLPLSREISQLLKQIEHPEREVDPPLLGFPCANHLWIRGFESIQTAADIPEPYTFQDLRKSCNVHWQQLVSPGTGSHFLGHSPRGVNAKNYSEDVLLMVKAAQLREGI